MPGIRLSAPSSPKRLAAVYLHTAQFHLNKPCEEPGSSVLAHSTGMQG